MPALVERPKMSLAMWAALKTHIMKQREKKKQEQEADAAVERLRIEQEQKRKKEEKSLEEVREEHAQLEKKLKELKNEKHELFLYLKRVINEDDKRKSCEEKEANEMMHAGHPTYPGPGMPLGNSNMYMIAGNAFMNRNQVLYKVNAAPQQNGAIKRPRSPSPPNTSYSQGFPYKTHVTSYGQKPAPFGSTTNSAFYPHSTATSSGTSSTMVVTNSTPYYPVAHPPGPYSPQDQAKHLSAGFRGPHLAQQNYGPLHQQMEHNNQKQNAQEEKYYIQAGGISSGYPIRGQPLQTRFQPPTSHSSSSPIQHPSRKDDIIRRNPPNENQK